MNKKLFFGLAATFAVAVAVVCTTLALNNTSSNYSTLQAANIEALTGYELIDIEQACDDWCIDDPYDMCWLLTNYGDLYCYGWDEPF